ncbi:hypothetical protein Pelo_19061 [Pelomyxa schiedti]|nr:hypothetical protein Pelo_19061 [Pelomyxa schiedti]
MGVALNREEGLRLLRIGFPKRGTHGASFKWRGLWPRKETQPRSTQQWLRWLKLACDQGLPGAQYSMALELGNTDCCGGKGKENHQVESLRLFKLAAAQGMAAAQSELSMLYLKGNGGVEQSHQTAVKYLSLAAKRGNPEAQGGVEKDEAKAFSLVQRAAKSGMAGSHVTMGVMYLRGSSATPRDLVKASHNFRLALKEDCNCTQAASLLSNLIFRGGVPGTQRERRWTFFACPPSP